MATKQAPSGRALTFDEFRAVYHRSVADVLSFWSPEMQKALAAHNAGYLGETTNFETYLKASDIRYFMAYEAVVRGRESARICDIGGFWGAWPLTLVRLGHSATMTEALDYFGQAFTPLFDYLRGEGVRVVDYDPFQEDATLDATFDGVTVLAVLEHYPHSLATFMANCKGLLEPSSMLYLEVPNLAYWPWRINLLKGRSPLVDVGMIYRSQVPFTGHHHEFTMPELTTLVELSGLVEHEQVGFNYSPDPFRWRSLLGRGGASALAQEIAFRLRIDAREVIGVTAHLPANGE